MGPETMIACGKSAWLRGRPNNRELTCCNAQPGVEVVENGKGGGGALEGKERGRDKAHERDDDDKVDIQPVDMLVPVCPCDGGFCDVRLGFPGGAWSSNGGCRGRHSGCWIREPTCGE